jgi:hypothetical protein
LVDFDFTHMISEFTWMKSLSAMLLASATLTVVAELVISALKVVVAVVGTVYAGSEYLLTAASTAWLEPGSAVPSWARTTVRVVVEGFPVTNSSSVPT